MAFVWSFLLSYNLVCPYIVAVWNHHNLLAMLLPSLLAFSVSFGVDKVVYIFFLLIQLNTSQHHVLSGELTDKTLVILLPISNRDYYKVPVEKGVVTNQDKKLSPEVNAMSL